MIGCTQKLVAHFQAAATNQHDCGVSWVGRAGIFQGREDKASSTITHQDTIHFSLWTASGPRSPTGQPEAYAEISRKYYLSIVNRCPKQKMVGRRNVQILMFHISYLVHLKLGVRAFVQSRFFFC